MSEYSAKTLREKMKAKARSLANPGNYYKDQEVSSADWSPAPPLKTEMKTGARPIMKPSSKGTGESYAARDTKKAIGADMKRGAFKAGGAVKKSGVSIPTPKETLSTKEIIGANPIRPTRGKVKKNIGGVLEKISPAYAVMRSIQRGPDEEQQTKSRLQEAAMINAARGAKKGGVVKKADGGDIDSSKTPQRTTAAQNVYTPKYNEDSVNKAIASSNRSGKRISGKESSAIKALLKGRTGRAGGGFLENIGNALMGRGYIDGSTWMSKDEPVTASDTAEKISPAQHAKERAMGRRLLGPSISKAQYAKERAMGEELLRPRSSTPEMDRIAFADTLKKGGKVKRKDGGKIKKAGGGSSLEKMVGKPKGSDYSQVGKMGTANYTQEDKGALNRALKGDDSLPEPAEAAERSGKYQNYKKGGRAERKAGGRTRAKGKTNINIVIAAGRKAGPEAPALDMAGGMPSAPANIPVPMPGAGAPPPAAMPMGGPPGMPAPGIPGMPAPGIPGMPPGRKAGGRITKIASSYKDMQAGSGSGEGRLQKTDIAKKHHDAPARRAGGKVYSSYKDMDAGAGSGFGRLEKTEIEKKQRARGK